MSNSSLLELKTISKTYGSPDGPMIEVLKNINLSVNKGESIAIVGPSGSGKSTLLNIAGTLLDPTSGTITINGQHTSTMNEQERAALRNTQLGFIFQRHHLLPQCNVLENVLIPTIVNEKSKDSRELGKRLLDYVGLSGRLSHLPGSLSVGECQRVAVARALINEPQLLLADEPTGSLDSDGADNLSELFARLNKEENLAIIAVTHSHNLAKQMQKQLTLSSGSLS